MKAVFDTKPTSRYDDDLTRHYQFPRRYLAAVSASIGDWVVLRRPRADGGNLAYFAVARVEGVESDLSQQGMSYARLSEYLEFDVAVPWTVDGRYAEGDLRAIPRAQVGVYLRGRSVRSLADGDFADIVRRGFPVSLDAHNAERLGVPPAALANAAEALKEGGLPGERDRRVVSVLTNRIVREASFRTAVYRAYANCCAVTGLELADAKGNCEAQAAHIWSVADGGPDVVQNGLALTATVHWLFDRHLISLSDDHRLLMVENRIPHRLRALFQLTAGHIRLPARQQDWPHLFYVRRHRERFEALNS